MPTENDDEVPYQHLVVALADGLRELGIACYANVDYWPLDPERTRYLLTHDPAVGPDDCALVVVSDDWFRTGGPFPGALQRKRGCWILLDRDDGTVLKSLEPPFRAFDFILRTHFNESTRYRANFVPWAYGLSARIVQATSGDHEPHARRWELLANWRHSAHPHSLRLDVERNVLPRLQAVMPIDRSREAVDAPPDDPREKLWWRETGRRHWPAYYERLMSSAACAAFGGFFFTRWPAEKESRLSRGLKAMLTVTRRRSNLVAQFDSWRLWESLAAGCATFHVDFERYGCVLPVMPVNWTHYIGIDLERCDEAVERLLADPSIVERVGRAGRLWALAHYGPAATAQRLLALAG